MRAQREGPTSAKVALKDVCVQYVTAEGVTRALENVNIEIEEGVIAALVGPSGCGKSTLLSLVAGLLRPNRGSVTLDGREITGPSRQIGYMLQEDFLFPWRDILSNVTIGLEVQGRLNAHTCDRARALLDKYGLGEFIHHRPYQLSGGMRQRAALIRTLATDPEVLLLDEPLSALDYQTRLTLQEEIARILRRENKTVLLVTHNIHEAVSMSDRVMIMTRRPGTVKSSYDIPLEHRDINSAGELSAYVARIWADLDHSMER
ncbi:MAG: ABC transporter ATP-binding protein [Bacillota bacterium]